MVCRFGATGCLGSVLWSMCGLLQVTVHWNVFLGRSCKVKMHVESWSVFHFDRGPNFWRNDLNGWWRTCFSILSARLMDWFWARQAEHIGARGISLIQSRAKSEFWYMSWRWKCKDTGQIYAEWSIFLIPNKKSSLNSRLLGFEKDKIVIELLEPIIKLAKPCNEMR